MLGLNTTINELKEEIKYDPDMFTYWSYIQELQKEQMEILENKIFQLRKEILAYMSDQELINSEQATIRELQQKIQQLQDEGKVIAQQIANLNQTINDSDELYAAKIDQNEPVCIPQLFK